MIWFKARFKRLKSKWRHLHVYLKTLSQANDVERLTDLAQCKKPVLLLYGFGATRRSVSILETRLRQDGFDVLSLRLGGFLNLFNTHPIDLLAQKVSQKIEGLCERYPLPKLCIIGYSKGGLIGRYYVSRLGGDRRVHTLITLATPHQGIPWFLGSTLLLGGFFSRGLRQMLPRSKFMRHLSRVPLPPNVYSVSIYSTQDRTCPARLSLLPEANNGMVRNVLIPFLNHSDFIIKQSAYRTILTHILKGFKFSS